MTRVSIEADGAGYGRVLVDEQDISNIITGVDVHTRPGRGAAVTLTLRSSAFHFDGDTEVRIDARSHDALVALGWTPPIAEAP